MVRPWRFLFFYLDLIFDLTAGFCRTDLGTYLSAQITKLSMNMYIVCLFLVLECQNNSDVNFLVVRGLMLNTHVLCYIFCLDKLSDSGLFKRFWESLWYVCILDDGKAANTCTCIKKAWIHDLTFVLSRECLCFTRTWLWKCCSKPVS